HASRNGAKQVGINALVQPSRVFIMIRARMDVVAAHVDELVMWIEQKRGHDSLQDLIDSFLSMQQLVSCRKTNPSHQARSGDEQRYFSGVEALERPCHIDDKP